jgi:hypothetical protein
MGSIFCNARVSCDNTAHRPIFLKQNLVSAYARQDVNAFFLCMSPHPLAKLPKRNYEVSVVVNSLWHNKVRDCDTLRVTP